MSSPPTAHTELTKQALFKQVSLALVSSLCFMDIGLIRGFSSPGLPSLRELDPHIVPDIYVESWITSVATLGGGVGCVVAAPLMQRFGRKRVILISSPVYALAWLFTGFADSPLQMILARFITGIGTGIAFPASNVYVSECSHPAVRGLLTSLPPVAMVLGTLVQYLLGVWLDWRRLAWVSAGLSCTVTVLLLPFPESPSWLRLKGRDHLAAYRWYRLAVEDKAGRGLLPGSPGRLLRRGVLLPFALSMAVFLFQQGCGNDVVVFNTVSIFEAAGGTVDKHMSTVIVGAVHIFFVVVATLLVDRVGRRPLLLVSAGAMSLSMYVLGLYFYLSGIDQASGLGFLPLATLVIYITAYSLGFATVPYILLGELIPLSHRSVLGPLSASTSCFAMYVELKTYPIIAQEIGKDGAFWIYASFNLLAVFFIFFLIPETKGKSLEEIEKRFRYYGNKREQESNKAVTTR